MQKSRLTTESMHSKCKQVVLEGTEKMVFEARRDFFVVFMDFYRRVVSSESGVDGCNESTNSFPLTGIVVCIIANDHPSLRNEYTNVIIHRHYKTRSAQTTITYVRRNCHLPRLRTQFRGDLNHNFGCNRHQFARCTFQVPASNYLQKKRMSSWDV